MMRFALSLLLSLSLFSCDLFGLLPPGGGGGTVEGDFEFSTGFVFVRRVDGNLYAVNDDEPSDAFALTQGGGVHAPSLSADKKRVVFVTGSGEDAAIVTVPVAGGAASTLLSVTGARYRDFRTPVFSPDGQRVAFSYSNGSISEVAVINADGTGLASLAANDVTSFASPTWSPDGASLYVAAGNALSELSQVARITVANEAVEYVTNTLGSDAQAIAGRLVVSPDGTKAVFDGRVSSGATRIFTIALNGGAQVTQVYEGSDGVETFPSWVDDSTVAFSSDTGGNDNVYRAALPSTDSPVLLVPSAIEGWYSR